MQSHIESQQTAAPVTGLLPPAADPSFYQTLVEHMLDLIHVVDATGRVLYASPSVWTVIGRRPEDVVNRNVFESIHPDDLAHTREAFEMAVRSARPSARIQYRCAHQDGRWLRFEAVGCYWPGLAGAGLGIITSRDITDRVELEERYHRAQRLELMGRMMAPLVHDFNNLLTAISGYAQLLTVADSTGDVQSHAEEIQTAAEGARTLTRQLLSFVRGGVQPTDRRLCDVNQVIDELSGILGRLVDKRVQLTCGAAATTAVVAVERARFEQMVINLVVNARDAMPEGGAIAVTSRDGAPGESAHAHLSGHHIVIEVADTGTGIAPAVRERMFEPFFSTKPLGQGTGLGLSTVLEIVQQANGVIDVDTADGGGTVFRIRLARTVRPAAVILQ